MRGFVAVLAAGLTLTDRIPLRLLGTPTVLWSYLRCP